MAEQPPDDWQLGALCLDGILRGLMDVEQYTLDEMVAECKKVWLVLQSKNRERSWQTVRAEGKRLGVFAANSIKRKLKLCWFQTMALSLGDDDAAKDLTEDQMSGLGLSQAKTGRSTVQAAASGSSGGAYQRRSKCEGNEAIPSQTPGPVAKLNGSSSASDFQEKHEGRRKSDILAAIKERARLAAVAQKPPETTSTQKPPTEGTAGRPATAASLVSPGIKPGSGKWGGSDSLALVSSGGGSWQEEGYEEGYEEEYDEGYEEYGYEEGYGEGYEDGSAYDDGSACAGGTAAGYAGGYGDDYGIRGRGSGRGRGRGRGRGAVLLNRVRLRRAGERWDLILNGQSMGTTKTERQAVLVMEATNWKLCVEEEKQEMTWREIRKEHLALINRHKLESFTMFPMGKRDSVNTWRTWVLKNLSLHMEDLDPETGLGREIGYTEVLEGQITVPPTNPPQYQPLAGRTKQQVMQRPALVNASQPRHPDGDEHVSVDDSQQNPGTEEEDEDVTQLAPSAKKPRLVQQSAHPSTNVMRPGGAVHSVLPRVPSTGAPVPSVVAGVQAAASGGVTPRAFVGKPAPVPPSQGLITLGNEIAKKTVDAAGSIRKPHVGGNGGV